MVMEIDFEKDHWFWHRVDRSDPDGCWPWRGGQRKGIGRIKFHGSRTDPRRVAYFLVHGDLPKGRQVRSWCKNSLCCKPHDFGLGKKRREKPNPKLFWDNVRKTEECWIWVGPAALVPWGKHHYPAWKVAWMVVKGAVPKRLFLSRQCRTDECINPDHFRPIFIKPAPETLTASNSV